MFSSKIIKQNLKFAKQPFTSSYELLLEKSGKPTITLSRESPLCTEVYETLNSPNPCFMQELLKLRETNTDIRKNYKLNLEIPVVNQVTYGTKKVLEVSELKYGTLYHTI